MTTTYQTTLTIRTMSAQKPGLLILDMSNDQMKGVLYNKGVVIANVAQLAISAYFQVCVSSKEDVPAFRAKQKGAKLVDELVDLHHLKDLPKKTDSALSNPAVLDTFKSVGVTHVCICGASTDSSVYNTAKDLVANGFEIYVVRDATTSKNGRFGHDKGLRRLQSEFGEQCVVGIDDLLGEEEVVEEEVVEEVVAVPAAAPSPAPMSDAERLAARKKQVDEARFAHIKQANAAALANADEKRASEIQKDSTEAELFAKNLPQNKAPPVPEEAPAAVAPPAKKGLMGGFFGRGKKDPKESSSAAPVTAPTPIPTPAPTPKPVSASAVPGGGAGQKTWIKPKPEGGKTTSYTADGAVSQPLGVKKMVQGNDVQHRIAGLQTGGLSTVPVGPRTMKTPKIVTDTKETWDKQGNITREITRYITEIDGTKRTEKEIVKIPAKK